MNIDFLLSEFHEHEVYDIVRLYISKALFTDEPQCVFKAIKLLEELHEIEIGKVSE